VEHDRTSYAVATGTRSTAQDVTAGRDERHFSPAAIGLSVGLASARFSTEKYCSSLFQTVCDDGTWRRLHDALYCRTRQPEGREEQPSFAIIDSQSVKTGPDARSDVGYDAGKKIKGRKRHIFVDTLGMLLKAEVHSAGIQDRDGRDRQLTHSSSPDSKLHTRSFKYRNNNYGKIVT
jgi:hypothetical protein